MAARTMNNAAKKIAGAALLLGAALSLPACQRPAADPPLAGAAIGGPFTLTDQDGRTVTDQTYQGRYRLVYFGFTYCPDVCPTTLQKLAAGLRQFEQQAPERAAKIQPILISVDPDRDTPAVMKQYVAAFHPRLVGLTGDPAAIAKVAKQYGVYYQKRQEQTGSSGYLVDHSSAPLLFGPDGKPIALIPADEGAEAVARTLDQWVQ
jgi:protein SCO1/2